MDVTDERVHKTNLMNPDRSVKLTAKDIAIYFDTECVVTKAYVKKRLDAWKKAHPESFKSGMAAGNKEYEDMKKERAAKKVVEEKNSLQMSPDEVAHMNRKVNYRKKSNGHVDISGLLANCSTTV